MPINTPPPRRPDGNGDDPATSTASTATSSMGSQATERSTVRTASYASMSAGMTPSPSVLSIFSHNDEGMEMEDEDDDNDNANDDGNDDVYRYDARRDTEGERAREPVSSSMVVVDGQRTEGVTASKRAEERAESKRLSQELLDALYLGTGNFLLAYNTRAGIGVLLRVFKLLRKRQFSALLNLTELLDEKHVSFRVDAVSMGLFLGWFTGGYSGLRALLPHLLRRFFRQRQQLAHTRRQTITTTTTNTNKNAATPAASPSPSAETIDEASTLLAGAIAGCAIVFMNAKRRRSLALYALTRALQCAYNTAKRRELWHFWGSQWEYGDALLFALSSAQVMYAYVMRPTSLPSEYFRFIEHTGPVKSVVLEMVRRSNRALPQQTELLHSFMAKHGIHHALPAPHQLVPCRFVHHKSELCVDGVVRTFRRAFTHAFPLYLSLFIVPSVVIHFKKFLAHPFRTLGRAVLGATRSNVFVSSFCSLYLALICAHRRTMTTDHRFVYYLAGLGASTAIFIEPKSRRSELALYVLPRALDSLYIILRDRRIFSGMRNGEILVFSLSMACVMYSYEHENDTMSPFVRSTIKRFLQTATEKKKIFIANLEQHQRARAASNLDTANGNRDQAQHPVDGSSAPPLAPALTNSS